MVRYLYNSEPRWVKGFTCAFNDYSDFSQKQLTWKQCNGVVCIEVGRCKTQLVPFTAHHSNNQRNDGAPLIRLYWRFSPGVVSSRDTCHMSPCISHNYFGKYSDNWVYLYERELTFWTREWYSRASLTVRITVKNGNPPGTGKIRSLLRPQESLFWRSSFICCKKY